MGKLKRVVQDDRGIRKQGTTARTAPQPKVGRKRGRSRTAGTDRDFDESGRSVNQGHGHPREERGRSSR